MRVLHVSDLHVDEGRSLENLWTCAQGALESQLFDFIVVSGDLSQKADTNEYTRLLKLANERVLPLLKQREKERVIFVPGNHDVDWGVSIGSPVSLVELGETVKDTLAKARRLGGQGPIRHRLSDYGHLELCQIDQARYPQRFANVQRFLDDFYGSLSPPHRKMCLLDTEAQGSDWSAHVFKDDGVAFFGLNSCHRSDRYWAGASFNPRAIGNVAEFAKLHCRDMLRIAVWHHGLQSDSRREDYISIRDIAAVVSQGIRVGFHGHTHKEELQLLDGFLRGAFAISAVGSLGAGASDRPEAVRNQFSVVQLYPNQLHADLYEQYPAGDYRTTGSSRSLYFLPESGAFEALISALEHRREYVVDNDGLACVKVTLRTLHLKGLVPVLAVVTPPSSRIIGDKQAVSERGLLPVTEETDHSKSRRFEVKSAPTSLAHLTWSYYLSNGFALSRADFEGRSVNARWMPNHEPMSDGRPHTVRIRCDHLVLRTQLPATVEFDDAKPLVERQEEGKDSWTRVPSEEHRCSIVREGAAIELHVDSPIPGYRYCAMYRILAPGLSLDAEGVEFCAWLSEVCRASPPENSALATALTTAIEKALAGQAVLGDGVARLTWLGLVWRPKGEGLPRGGRLLGAFGRFPPYQWSTEYPWGAGVAGHALRFSKMATWARGRTDKENIIFIPPTRRDLEWLVCVPLLTGEDGPSVGVLSFEGGGEGVAAATLKSLAARRTDEAESALEPNLETTVNQVFWSTLALHPATPAYHKAYANRVIGALRLARSSLTPPPSKIPRDSTSQVTD